MRLILASVLLIAISGLAVADELKHRDGNWWEHQSDTGRTFYVLGMLDGMPIGRDFSVWKYGAAGRAPTPEETDAIDKAQLAYSEAVVKFLSNVTVKQLMDGLTTFYADYKNRRIETANAMFLVLMAISGVPQQQLDTATETFRKAATQ
jgi:hypothetical protein